MGGGGGGGQHQWVSRIILKDTTKNVYADELSTNHRRSKKKDEKVDDNDKSLKLNQRIFDQILYRNVKQRQKHHPIPNPTSDSVRPVSLMRLAAGVVSSAAGAVIGTGAEAGAAGSGGAALAASAMAVAAACRADSAASRLMMIFLGLAAGVAGVSAAADVVDVSNSFVSSSSGCQK